MRILGVLVLALLVAQSSVAWASSAQKAQTTNTRGFEYLELKPGFVVNFGATGRVGFLKVDMSLKIASAAKAPVEEHTPAIRHELIMLLSRQDEAALGAGEARETLRLAALQTVRTLLVEAAGIEAEDVQDLLFTAFMTQR
jgi:flagellar FliL protein